MPDRISLLAFASGVALITAGATAAAVIGRSGVVIALAVGLAAGHAIALATASGRRIPLTAAVAAAGALLSGASPGVMLAAGAVGLPLGFLVVLIHRGSRALRELFPAEPAGYLAFCAVVAGVHGLAPHTEDSISWVDLGVIVLGAVAWFVVELVVRSTTAGSRRRLGRRLLLRRGVVEWQAFGAVVAAGTIFGVTIPAMGWWAIPLAGVPYLFSHVALARARHTQQTYRQTIGVLGRIPEAGGFSPPGHAERTAELAVAMGAEIGLSLSELDRVENAALLHDIGRLVLNDPAIVAGGYSTRDLAQWSAAIVSEVRHLQPVADVVAEHYRPYRRPGEERDETLATAAQIVKIASAYTVAVFEGMGPTDALEMLHQGIAYDYDPDLVGALRKILRRRGAV